MRLSRAGLIVASALLTAASATASPTDLDAVVAAPASHQVVLENDRVRVLRVVIPAGRTEPVHTHGWPSIMRVEQPQPLTYITYAIKDGRLVETARKLQPIRKPAEAEWMEPEGPHAVQNRGQSDYIAIRIELKPQP